MNPSVPISRKRVFFYHLVWWVIFIAYELTFLFFSRNLGTRTNIWGGYVFPYVINIALFYFHALVALNVSFRNGRNNYILFVLFLATELSLYLFLMSLVSWVFSSPETSKADFLGHVNTLALFPRIWRALYFLIFSTGLWFILKYLKSLKELQEANTRNYQNEKEKHRIQLQLVSTQNAFLQSQINPHLIFNTLNFIYNKVRLVSPESADAIITLSEMMRYSLNNGKSDGKVLLRQELEQIENLIRINEFRFSNQLHINIHSNKEDFHNFRIIPLLLLPFVENIFKYADLQDADRPASISILVNENKLSFKTSNKKRNPVNYHSQKIGIENVKSRLEAHYPGNYFLNVEDREDSFLVTLELFVNEPS